MNDPRYTYGRRNPAEFYPEALQKAEENPPVPMAPTQGPPRNPETFQQPQSQPAPQQPQKTLADRFMNPLTQAGLQMLSNAQSGRRGSLHNVGNAIERGVRYQEGKRVENETKDRVNRTAQALSQKLGIPMDQAEAIVRTNPGQAVKALTGGGADQWENVGGALHNKVTGEWRLPPDGGTKGSLNIQYGYRDGKLVGLQLQRDGTMKEVELPDGVTSLVTPEQLAADKARGSATGKAEGEAGFRMRGAPAGIERTVNRINALIDHPGLEGAVGPVQGYLPTFARGPESDFVARYNQISGTAFMEAREMLKGGGQITDYEGQRAEDAVAALSRAQTEEQFRESLQQFRDAVIDGYRKLAAAAGQQGITIDQFIEQQRSNISQTEQSAATSNSSLSPDEQAEYNRIMSE
jgi:hypothetical protein